LFLVGSSLQLSQTAGQGKNLTPPQAATLSLKGEGGLSPGEVFFVYDVVKK